MYAFIRPFLQLCLLNSNPQDLPPSDALLRISLFCYLLVSVILALPVYSFVVSLLQALLDVVLLIVYTRTVLHFTMHIERYNQTLSALAGTGVIFGVLVMPLAFSSYQAAAQQINNNAMTLLAYLLILGWLLTVYGHVFRHALSSGMFIGILVGLGYILLTSMIIETVFPPPKWH